MSQNLPSMEYLNYLAESGRWEELIRQLPTKNIDSSELLLALAGRAYAGIGREEYDIRALNKAAQYLMQAWSGEATTAEIFWPLTETLYVLGRQKDCISVFKRYLEIATDHNERIKVASTMIWSLDVLGDHQQAVEIHQRIHVESRVFADPVVLLESYLNPHVTNAYCCNSVENSRFQWIEQLITLWLQVESSVKLEQASSLVNAIHSLLEPHKETQLEQIGLFVDRLIKELQPEHYLSQQGSSILQQHALLNLSLYHFFLHLEQAERAQMHWLNTVEIADILHKTALLLDQSEDGVREAAFVVLNNVGMLSGNKGYDQSLMWLKKAEQVRPYPCGPHSFWLSALIVKNGGDKQEALKHLKNVAHDKKWAFGGMCVRPQEQFYRHETFASVQGDPDFIAVIESFRQHAN